MLRWKDGVLNQVATTPSVQQSSQTDMLAPPVGVCCRTRPPANELDWCSWEVGCRPVPSRLADCPRLCHLHHGPSQSVAEPSRAEPNPRRAEPRPAEPGRAEPAEASRAEPSRGQPSRAEPSRAERSRGQPSRAELSQPGWLPSLTGPLGGGHFALRRFFSVPERENYFFDPTPPLGSLVP